MNAVSRSTAAPRTAAPVRPARLWRRTALLAADVVAIAACLAVVVDAVVR